EAQLEDLATRAFNLVVQDRTIAGLHTAVTAETQGKGFGVSPTASSPLSFVRGARYELAAVCRGRGRVDMVWKTPGGPFSNAKLVCNGDIYWAQSTAQVDGGVTIWLTPDAVAVDRSAVAVGVVELEPPPN